MVNLCNDITYGQQLVWMDKQEKSFLSIQFSCWQQRAAKRSRKTYVYQEHISVGSFRLAPVSPEHGMKWMSFFGLKPTFFKNGTNFSLHSSYLRVQTTGGMSKSWKEELKSLQHCTDIQTDFYASSNKRSRWNACNQLVFKRHMGGVW